MRIGATKDSKSEIKNFYSFYSFTFVPFLLHSIMSYLTVFLRHLLLPIKQAARFLKMFDRDYTIFFKKGKIHNQVKLVLPASSSLLHVGQKMWRMTFLSASTKIFCFRFH